MPGYPVLEHEGYSASISTKREATGRWMCWVAYARDADFADTKPENLERHRVPNDYPSEDKAVLAAYEHARALITKETIGQ